MTRMYRATACLGMLFAPVAASIRPVSSCRPSPVSTRWATLFLTLLLSPLLVSTARGAYPSPPHDFSHPGTPHPGRPLLSPMGGHESRITLVIYARWDDVDYPAEFDAAAVARRFFGSGFPSTEFPSVGDYFRRLSFNDIFLFPILETQGAQDGVVQVHVPGTKAEFFTQPEDIRNRVLVELADPYVDYAYYDTDGNGALSNLELVVNAYEAAPETPKWRGLGITNPIAATTLDGVALGDLDAAMTNTSTNLVTIIHENAHVLFDMPDLYGFGVGRLDLAGPTGNFPDSTLFAPSAWHKMHLGWIRPTVVEQDGFYEVRRADTTGDAFILYDPDRGPDDYFIVENRVLAFNTYEWGISDGGLVIWRISDSSLGVEGAPWPIELMAPDGVRRVPDWPGAPWDAWDPSDPETPQRTMSQPWADGTPTGIAVRAVYPAGDVVRAYFDVPGPGVLVDTYPLDSAGPVRAVAGGVREIDVPIMNTAESGCDTFDVDPVNLPAGWTMTRGARILCYGESSPARVTVTPPGDAAVGVYTIGINATARGSGVSTTAPLDVEVALLSTRFDLAALVTMAPASVSPTFEIDLGADDGPVADLAGVPVRFTLTGPGDTVVLETITDADGVATVRPPELLEPGTWTLTIESERRDQLAPTSTTVAFRVLTVEETIGAVVDEIGVLLATSPNAGVRSALKAAMDELVGNLGGSPPTNGALDKLAADDPVGAITKLRSAISYLLTAQTKGAGSTGRLADALGLSAQAVATASYEPAKEAVGTPSAGEAKGLERIATLIELGRGRLDANRPLDACDSFRQAASRAIDLAG